MTARRNLPRHFSREFSFPATVEPRWSKSVERWYQLDAYSYGLVDTIDQWILEGKISKPDFIFLASPGSSHSTDFAFTQSGLKLGSYSPSKFVHTLPNVRGSSLLEANSWTVPLLCIQQDPHSYEAALMEADDWSRTHPGESIWVLGVQDFNDLYLVEGWFFS